MIIFPNDVTVGGGDLLIGTKSKDPHHGMVPIEREDPQKSWLGQLNLKGQDLRIGPDGRLYSEAHMSFGKLRVPEQPKEKARLVLTELLPDKIPSAGQLKWLFNHLFSHYAREVHALWGIRKDGEGLRFCVPRQEGTVGGVEWKDPELVDWFLTDSRWGGTLHSHPGKWCSPSGVDTADWAEKDRWGLHFIFGRAPEIPCTMNVAVDGYTATLTTLEVGALPEEPVKLYTWKGLPLNEVLLKPPPPKKSHIVWGGKGSSFTFRKKGKGGRNQKARYHYDPQEVATRRFTLPIEGNSLLELVDGVIRVEPDELDSLMYVQDCGETYVMSRSRFQSLREEFPEVRSARRIK